MVTISTGKDMSLEDIVELYTSGDEGLYTDYDELYKSILNSDYCITARDQDRLVGIIRSNGDGNINQYIAEIVMHAGCPTQGIGSKLLDAYLDTAADVSKIYILSHGHYRTSFSKTWLQYKGFKLLAENDSIILYLLDRKIKY
ncbi:hypothetical protein GCM10007275_20910 [Jeotgalicoccus coquinae]|uniref:N-acetylglutamate synthase-like GNAT family acetyltransferase n=1 Tax=Jeotgalicoccus coquinae TaxID=709509 RepID=A0A6V7RR43_9STAP|nr:GNAT family N-acetyltransferase [Jeotgalicoccus coquinae]MBB6424205.1 N-acetylglutamate synthase-like GNAT family acetyltransferase [Jeotgalicoccus coquinae]GGE25628.1 hypothetical protein GCM10007275_20910 [Jeotgalicoccus coquinae]CAD2081527.1 hypothetical protein JEOCOQ751_01996 [Jeotgalicoccus coquinae]